MTWLATVSAFVDVGRGLRVPDGRDFRFCNFNWAQECDRDPGTSATTV